MCAQRENYSGQRKTVYRYTVLWVTPGSHRARGLGCGVSVGAHRVGLHPCSVMTRFCSGFQTLLAGAQREIFVACSRQRSLYSVVGHTPE